MVGLTGFLTNFTSNMTAMMLMLSVGLSLTSGTGAIESLAITYAIIIVSDFAFIVPSSSNLIGMLYGDEYSSGNVIFKYGSVLAIIGALIVALIGYPFSFFLFFLLLT